MLKQLGRIHTYSEFEETYRLARKVGFKNINVDLMIGIPNQTEADVEATITKIVKLNPEHISIYSLIIEDNTKLANDVNTNKYILPDENLEREMYWLVKTKLEELGYVHYEISNFAKPGYESNHNLDCWNQHEYFGFGVGAHSYMDDIRFSNIESIEKYIKNYKRKEPNDNFIFHEKQDYIGKMKEYIMLRFRLLQGVNKEEFFNKFKIDIYTLFKEDIDKLIQSNLVKIEDNYLKLTDLGIDLANKVFEEFV